MPRRISKGEAKATDQRAARIPDVCTFELLLRFARTSQVIILKILFLRTGTRLWSRPLQNRKLFLPIFASGTGFMTSDTCKSRKFLLVMFGRNCHVDGVC